MDARDKLLNQLLSRIEKLESDNIALKAENLDLKRRLKKNSSNSSKPPSSDGLGRPNRAQSLRKTGQHKSGGQTGHKGQTLRQSKHPDSIKRHQLAHCPGCKGALADVEPVGLLKRQVFDVPEPSMKVTEHQVEVKVCPCCKVRSQAAFPEGVNAPVQYGPNIKSFAVYLQHQQLLPEDRLQTLFSDLFGVSLATATLNHFTEKLYDKLAEFETHVLNQVSVAVVKHLDETGFRIGGKTRWLHVASNESLTYYHHSDKRKSLLDGLLGTVIHDHWKPYYQLENVSHGLCNAHHLRELNALIEAKEHWAKKMKRFLLLALRYRHGYKQEPIPPDKLDRLIKLYDGLVQEGLRYHEALVPLPKKGVRGRTARRAGHNLLLRLRDFCGDVLRFLTDPAVPFTNNQAERDIRMMKCKQKISGGFRTNHGAELFTRIRGFISTANKQGWNIMTAIQQAFAGNLPLTV